jgi:hypothetical protein
MERVNGRTLSRLPAYSAWVPAFAGMTVLLLTKMQLLTK